MRTSTFGDHDFKGNGVLLCRICGEPYRDHEKIGPCEKAGLASGERFRTTSRRGDLVTRTEAEQTTYLNELSRRDRLEDGGREGET